MIKLKLKNINIYYIKNTYKMDRIVNMLSSMGNKFNTYKKFYFRKNQLTLGRWKVHQDTISMERKIDMANYDNCYMNIKYNK